MQNDMEGIICVTGNPRCGTSAMMQTLKLLGVPVPAQPFTTAHAGIEQFNPKGYFELIEAVGGVTDDRYAGQAIKMFPYALKNTPVHLISKIIRMQRNRTDACISYEPVKNIIENTNLSAFDIYDANEIFLNTYFSKNKGLFVTFEQFVESPLFVMEELIDYLEINPSLTQVKNAYNNIGIIEKLKS